MTNLMMKNLFLLIILIPAFALAAAAQTKMPVKFAKAAHSATLKGAITGDKYIDYVIGAKGGQTMAVSMKSSNPNIEYMVLDAAEATLEDSNGGGAWSDALPADGTYTIRVLLPRSAARRKGAAANFSITISIK